MIMVPGMDGKTKIKKMMNAVGLIACLAVLSACATNQLVKYTPIIDKAFDPVTQAELTKLSAEQLTSQGYVKIGEILTEQVLKECYDIWPTSQRSDCSEHAFDEHATAVLLKQAAKKGGQIVLLIIDNNVEDRKATKATGVCERERSEMQLVYRPVSTGPLGVIYGHVWETRRVCDQYRHVDGMQNIRKSVGSVWRKGSWE